MIFNEKFNRILNIAADKDPELREMLEYWFDKLTQSQKDKVRLGEEFKDIEATLTYSDNKDTSEKYGSPVINEIYLAIKEWNVQFNLFMKDVNEDWLNTVPELENLDENELINPSPLSRILYLHIIDYSQHYAKTYRMEVCKVKDRLVFNYVRTHGTILDTVVEMNSVTDVEEEDLNILISPITEAGV